MDTPPTTDRILTHGRVCKQCQYDLGGLLDATCPECGADLTSQMLPGVLRAITPAERAAAANALQMPSVTELRAIRTGVKIPRWPYYAMSIGILGSYGLGVIFNELPPLGPVSNGIFEGLIVGLVITFVVGLIGGLVYWFITRFGSVEETRDAALNTQRELIEADLTKGIVEEIHVVATHELVSDSDRGFRFYLKLTNGWILAIRDDAAPWRIRPSNIDGDDQVTGQNLRLVILPTSRACVALSTSGPACIRVRTDGIKPRVFAYRWASPAVFFPGERHAFKRAFWQLGVFARPMRSRPAVVKRNGATP